jgi:hypothetical protein
MSPDLLKRTLFSVHLRQGADEKLAAAMDINDKPETKG